jgi:hypothetical protein
MLAPDRPIIFPLKDREAGPASHLGFQLHALPIMNELKEKLAALGLSGEQVDGALQTVAEFVKSKMPEEYQGIVDSLLSGESPDLSALGGGLLDKIKGMLS